MATPKAPAVLTPLVADGFELIARIEIKKAERDAKGAELKELDAQLAALNEQLIVLGAGRYCDAEDRTCLVVAGNPGTIAPDTFRLPHEGEEPARALAGEEFKNLFERHVSYTPRDGFNGRAEALLTPAKARDLIAFCLVPGELTGVRRAYVRWK
jgi:hypothetical protein